jgi:hypothetical protein
MPRGRALDSRDSSAKDPEKEHGNVTIQRLVVTVRDLGHPWWKIFRIAERSEDIAVSSDVRAIESNLTAEPLSVA